MKTDMTTREEDLKGVGLKVTLPRRAILDLISNNCGVHLSAEDIHLRLRQNGSVFGLATVYRVLAQLETAGLVTRHFFDPGKAVYEINEGLHHDHLICVSCGRVDEFCNERIESLQAEVADARGYELLDHRLSLYGYCAACVSARRKASMRVIRQDS